MRSISLLSLAFLLGYAFGSNTLAQTNQQASLLEGSIEVFITRLSPIYADSLVSCDGIVQDSTTCQPIVGANVVVPGTKKAMATDLKGAFHLDGLSLAQTLRIFYVGFAAKALPVRSLSSLPSRVRKNQIPMDSTLANLDSTGVALIQQALREEFRSMQYHGIPDSTGGRKVLILDSLIQQRWLPQGPECKFITASLQEIEEIARQRRSVEFDCFEGMYRSPAVVTIIFKRMDAVFNRRLQKVLLPVHYVNTYRYGKEHGEWHGGKGTVEIRDYALPPDN